MEVDWTGWIWLTTGYKSYQYNYDIAKANNHFRLDYTSILYIYKVFKKLTMQWIVVWMRPYFIKALAVGWACWTWVTTRYELYHVRYIVLLQTVLVLWHLCYNHFSAVMDRSVIFRIRCPRASPFLRVFKWLELNVPSTFFQMYLRVLWIWLYPKIWMLWRPNCRCDDLSCQLSIAQTRIVKPKSS